MAATETLELAGRNVDELSGGQRQRVWIAMALAQETDVLLLDEPTTYLDLTHQVEVLDLITDLNRQRGTTVAIVLHDLNLAARYADHIIAMKGGRIVAEGAARTVVTEELVRDVFGLESRVLPDPVSGAPLIIPLGRHHADPHKPQPWSWSHDCQEPRPGTAPAALRTPPATEPMTLAFEVQVTAVQELGPNFRRVTFGGYSLRNFGVHGRHPGPAHQTHDPLAGRRTAPRCRCRNSGWSRPAGTASGWPWIPQTRGSMRTYTVRQERLDAVYPELDVDFVMHFDDAGHGGPAANWALQRQTGGHPDPDRTQQPGRALRHRRNLLRHRMASGPGPAGPAGRR